MKDWVRWHRDYDDPATALARRLAVVRRRVAEALGVLGPRARRTLSLCAGDGRDLLPVLALRPLSAPPPDGGPGTILVEKDPTLAARADRRARAHGLTGVRIVVGDAGDPSVFADVVPVDLLLLCGIFGNIARRDIEATVHAVPALVAPGGYVVWTCGRSGLDLRPEIRRLFTGTGLDETSFDGHPEPFGVGVARLPDITISAPTATDPLPEHLFTLLR